MTYHLFEVTGVELEYMIVDAETLDVRPIADRLLERVAGELTMEVERGPVAWSNELALHVIEFKTNGPVRTRDGLAAAFQADVRVANELLAAEGARLLPTAMHPWMDPDRDLRLWPHEANEIYATFDRIFSCRGHGWSNLQSAHLNLPFCGDEELGRLHAAIRILLPILPALSASSPVADGRLRSVADYRLEVYRHNAARVPSVAGKVIPEAVFTRADYERDVLGRIYKDLAPHDPKGVLRHEWANSRGAIVRFDRNAIEIRILDVQECPRADLAIADVIIRALEDLAAETTCSSAAQRTWETDRLAAIFDGCVARAGAHHIEDPDYAPLFGLPRGPVDARHLWRHLVERLGASDPGAVDLVLEQGSLSQRMARALGPEPGREGLAHLYQRLADCLADGEMLSGDA